MGTWILVLKHLPLVHVELYTSSNLSSLAEGKRHEKMLKFSFPLCVWFFLLFSFFATVPPFLSLTQCILILEGR